LVVSFHAASGPQPNTEPPIATTVELQALPALLTVAEVAEILRVARSWVYEHAGELGAVKLGTGQTAPLRIPRDGLQRIVGVAPPRRRRRSVPARRAREAQAAAGELRARPRL
jgi:excisionase family DNA binding protein